MITICSSVGRANNALVRMQPEKLEQPQDRKRQAGQLRTTNDEVLDACSVERNRSAYPSSLNKDMINKYLILNNLRVCMVEIRPSLMVGMHLLPTKTFTFRLAHQTVRRTCYFTRFPANKGVSTSRPLLLTSISRNAAFSAYKTARDILEAHLQVIAGCTLGILGRCMISAQVFQTHHKHGLLINHRGSRTVLYIQLYFTMMTTLRKRRRGYYLDCRTLSDFLVGFADYGEEQHQGLLFPIKFPKQWLE